MNMSLLVPNAKPLKIRLQVPYGEGTDARKSGCFGNNRDGWFINKNHQNKDYAIWMWGPDKHEFHLNGKDLIGEDRMFGGNNLTIRLIPQSLWGKSRIKDSDYKKLKQLCFKRCNNKCEYCGYRGKCQEIVMDKIWDYNEKSKTRTLKRLICSCKNCDDAVHMGRSRKENKYIDAREHFKKITNCTNEQLIEHDRNTSKLWGKHNEIEWIDDISILTNSNVRIYQEFETKDK